MIQHSYGMPLSSIGKSNLIQYKWAIFNSHVKLPEGTCDNYHHNVHHRDALGFNCARELGKSAAGDLSSKNNRTGWWLTYPSEKYWSIGMIIPNTLGK